MNDKNDLTLTSIFAGDNNSNLLPLEVRRNRHSRVSQLFKSKSIRNAVATNLHFNVEPERIEQNISVSPLSTGSHIRPTGKMWLDILGMDIDLENSVFVDNEPFIYYNRPHTIGYTMICECCGAKMHFNKLTLCDKCQNELHESVSKDESLRNMEL